MTTISRNLGKLRKNKTAYSQKEFAELLGIKQNTYSTWESGEADVKSEYIPKIAELLEVEIKDLFENTSTNIKINQVNKNNKENSVNNGMVFIIQDEKSIEKIVSILKENVQKSNP